VTPRGFRGALAGAAREQRRSFRGASSCRFLAAACAAFGVLAASPAIVAAHGPGAHGVDRHPGQQTAPAAGNVAQPPAQARPDSGSPPGSGSDASGSGDTSGGGDTNGHGSENTSSSGDTNGHGSETTSGGGDTNGQGNETTDGSGNGDTVPGKIGATGGSNQGSGSTSGGDVTDGRLPTTGGGSAGPTPGPVTTSPVGPPPVAGTPPGSGGAPAPVINPIAPANIQLPNLGLGVEDAFASGGAPVETRSGARGAAVGLGTRQAAPAAGPRPPAVGGFLAVPLLTRERFAPIAPAREGVHPAARPGPRLAVATALAASVPGGVWFALAGLGTACLLFAGTTAAAVLAARRRGDQLSQFDSLALTDSLTGLLNRGALESRMTAEVERARRYGRPVSVVFFDVRGLKAVNDVHGHGAGDRVLKEVGSLLSRTSRGHDVCGRIGGDECVVVLPENDAVGAEAFLDRVYAGVPAARARLGLRTSWDLTGGVATFPQDGDTPRVLLDVADRRLYWHRGIEIDPPAEEA
jgi:diguanylate cyclase (GGDEF)-like protein